MGINVMGNPRSYVSPQQGAWLRAEIMGADEKKLEEIREAIRREPPMVSIDIPVTNTNKQSSADELMTLCKYVENMVAVDDVSQESLARNLALLICVAMSYAENNDIDLRSPIYEIYHECMSNK